ncbi:MAG TPA: GNAT family N-acetyltransferase [Stackebrandtia sp.]|uniref:GNAT family N-acetyltransferase n=1 Tax=Stackebrandtia sp. TaxID=2023065 RepID=UPI002D46C4DC|nr:GNAT family N-acetyltransferase [Stackebrandtia sp.]HZE41749.1 GNAT family N-acetyltransferase [Stackebrandtia sp.]
MDAPYTVVRGRDAIIAASGGDPFVSCFAATSATGIAADGAVAWHRRSTGRRLLLGYGQPAAAARLCEAAVAEFRPHRITVPAAVLGHLPDSIRPSGVGQWVWFHTRTAPPVTDAEGACRWFRDADHEELEALIERAFPGASNRPDAAVPGQRWFGATDDDGRIVACGVASTGDGIGPMLGSICVHPGARRRGLGSAITSWVTRQLLQDGHPMVALGSYVGEDATHRLYRRLGYRDTVTLKSGSLEPPIESLRDFMPSAAG